MSDGKRFRYVIIGAGAVGSALGGLLARSGRRVQFVARPYQKDALARGFLIRLGNHELPASAPAVTSIQSLSPKPGDLIVIATKSQHTAAAVDELRRVFDEDVPVLCLQNGTRNESIVAEAFRNVYGGLLWLSAVQQSPDVVSLAEDRVVVIGRFPRGRDLLTAGMAGDLSGAGLEAGESDYVMAMKWGKLVANLNNATHAITGHSLESALQDVEMRRLMHDVRLEGLRVLDAAGIAVEPPDDEPSPLRIRKSTAALLEPVGERPPLPPVDQRSYSSMWQDLALGRDSTEIDFLNGEVAEIGRRVGIGTPLNSGLVDVVGRMVADRLKPGLYGVKGLRSLLEQA